jgi:NAD(P)H dehydrogenase (quinone)
MGRILVIYFSATGNTKRMAELVAEGASKGGKHDVKLAPVQELDVAEVDRADGFAFGSPDYFTYMAGEMKTFFDRALFHAKAIKGKPFVTFMSHGGGGGGLESLDRLGAAVGLVRAEEGVKALNAPNKEASRECVGLGERLAAAVR